MSPNTEPPVPTPEWQRRAIEAHLVKHILDTDETPSESGSFYRQQPAEDSPLRRLFDETAGDPILFALFIASYKANGRVLIAITALHENPDNEQAEAELELARRDFAEVQTLTGQYVDPENHPFHTVDLTDERVEPYA